MNGNAAPVVPHAGLFRSIVVKEIRERIKIAFVCLAVVAAGQLFSIGFQRVMSASGFEVDASPSVIPFTFFTIASALAGLLIGRAQIVGESRGDRWGFLAHRPVTRLTLFFGKTVAGLVLYVVATGVPLAFATAWYAAPGHRAMPYNASMALPGVADLLCGIVYYFAALLIGMREAKWYGSRFLPLGGAVACTIATMYVSSFWAAAAVVLVGIAVGGLAASATVEAGGGYDPLTRASRAALGAMITAGLLLTGMVGVGIAYVAVATKEVAKGGNRPEGFAIASDGRVVHTVKAWVHFPEQPQVVEVSDLQGRAIGQYQDSTARRKLTNGVISAAQLPLNVSGRTAASFGGGYRGTRDLFVQITSPPPAQSTVSWYFIRGEGLLEAYDNRSARLVGRMGPDGFVSGQTAPSRRFQGPLRIGSEFMFVQRVLAFPSAVYRVDLTDRKIQTVFTPAAGDTVIGAVTSGDSTAATTAYGPRAMFTVIATKKSIYVQSADGVPDITVARPPMAGDDAMIGVSRAMIAPGAPTYLWYSRIGGAYNYDPAGRSSGQITEFGDGNREVAQFTLPQDSTEKTTGNVDAGDMLVALARPVTWSASVAAMRLLHGAKVFGGPASRRSEIVEGVLSAIASLVAAALAFLIGGTFAFERNRRQLWAALGFVLGPVGVLLMLSLIDMPLRENCPSCQRKRVVTRVHCEHCNAPFQPPPVDGTEIFEPATA